MVRPSFSRISPSSASVVVVRDSEQLAMLGLLPDELLSLVMRELLPPFTNSSLPDTFAFSVPADLHRARLVSRRVSALATPFAWRRIGLQIARPAPSFDLACGSAPKQGRRASMDKAYRRSLSRAAFFSEHPDLAAHVRVVLLTLEWHADCAEPARRVIDAATTPMLGLRTVLIWDDGVLPFGDISRILARPRLLRAVRLMDVDCSTFPLWNEQQGADGERGKLGGIKMLHIANAMSPARLVTGAAPDLECLSIELPRSPAELELPVEEGDPPSDSDGDDVLMRTKRERTPHDGPSMRDLPWASLKEVALSDCSEQDWERFVEGYAAHRLALTPPPAPFTLPSPPTLRLTELIVGDFSGLEQSRVEQVLTTFGGPGNVLKKLVLYYVVNMTPSVLGTITRAFRGLEDLTLLTDGSLLEWSGGSLDSYCHHLSSLPSLHTLTWNNLPLSPTAPTSLNALRSLYGAHASVLKLRVLFLRRVRFLSHADGFADEVDASTGRASRNPEIALHTSSWSTDSQGFEDL